MGKVRGKFALLPKRLNFTKGLTMSFDPKPADKFTFGPLAGKHAIHLVMQLAMHSTQFVQSMNSQHVAHTA
jgi:hypothetical protein